MGSVIVGLNVCVVIPAGPECEWGSLSLSKPLREKTQIANAAAIPGCRFLLITKTIDFRHRCVAPQRKERMQIVSKNA